MAPGRVVAIDTAGEILDEARATCAEAGVDNVEFRQARAEALPFPDAAFDVVHAHQLLQHVQDPVGVLKEMRRVCRPGGTVAARDADFHGQIWWPPEPMIDRWLALYSDVARSNGGEPDAGRRLVSWAKQAGFASIDPSASTWCGDTPERAAWWADLWAERTTSSKLGARAIELGLADEEELGRIADGWRRWARSPDAWLAFLHGEILARP